MTTSGSKSRRCYVTRLLSGGTPARAAGAHSEFRIPHSAFVRGLKACFSSFSGGMRHNVPMRAIAAFGTRSVLPAAMLMTRPPGVGAGAHGRSIRLQPAGDQGTSVVVDPPRSEASALSRDGANG